MADSESNWVNIFYPFHDFFLEVSGSALGSGRLGSLGKEPK